MPALEIHPFGEEHLDDAAQLLAARHGRHRAAEPLLPKRYEDPAAARDEIAALFRADGASGAVATRESRVVGYVLGIRKDDAVWGPNVWVDPAGQAVEQAEEVRDVYAAAGARWAAEGRTRHYAVVPASDGELLDAWFRLSFGAQHALAVRELPDSAEASDGVREAEPRDVESILELAPLLDQHQALAPVFSGFDRELNLDELRQEIAEDIGKQEVGNLVAEADGRLVGNFEIVPVEISSVHAGLARVEGASFLSWAATRPEVRGTGAGLALTNASFAWARAHGYETMATDWRVTNLLSSRFWTRRGFRPTFMRLYRSIP